PRTDFIATVQNAIRHSPETNLATLAIGVVSIAILVYFKFILGKQLKNSRLPNSLAIPISKSGPLIVVALGTVIVILAGLTEKFGVKVVGDVPAGLPPLTLPVMDTAVWLDLLPIALTIAFVGFMESISVAKSLASKKRQKVEADQELIALGAANLGAAFTGGYPVTGGFSRSVVNFEAGANTGLASIITAVLIALTVIFLTPLFQFLPRAVLAAIIMVAVFGLIDLKTLRFVWKYNKADAVSMIITFLAVLIAGIEKGILVGVAASLLLFIWRTSRPHVAVVGRLANSEIYRNVLRHDVETCAKAIAIRIDQSLYFANAKYLEDTVLGYVADHPEIEHFILIGTAVNFIDASALETLESLHRELSDAGVIFHLTAIKGPVMDRLKKVGFIDHFGADHIHETTFDAMKAIGCA
ncbi:MAG TPA: STAS domain-containing protein, partial [Anaerolineae bacterium]|nr:STAS domain-containing protein [Anaerolineae bacterium]